MKKSRVGYSLGSALLTALLLAPPAHAAGFQASAYEDVSVGTVARSSGVAIGPQLSSVSSARGARRIPRIRSTAAPATSLPQATSASFTAAPAALLESFNGVSSRDSAVTNFGQEFEPPDQGLCVGNGFVVEMVNSAYTVYRPNGTVISGPFNVNGPFDEGLTQFTSDPRCYFDAATHTWFATMLFINGESSASSLDVAVNTSGDPTTVWTAYKIDTTGVGGKTGPRHPGCPCFGDQPTLGIDGQNLYVTTNEFSIVGEQFNGAQIYAIAKKDLVSLSPALHFAHFANLSIGGSVASSVQPALSAGTPSAEFFLSSLDPTGTFDQRIGVWAMTKGALVAKGGKPKLSSLVLPAEAYGVPPKAEQRGAASLLDAGDDRMQQVQFTGSSVWGELDTALTIPGDSAQRAGAAWFQVEPTVAGGVIKSAQMKRQGYVALLGNYLLYPALAVTPSGTTAMVVAASGKTRFASAAYATLVPAATSFGPVNIAAPGSTSYDPDAERWGDYSWAVPDPTGTSAWLATEYVPPRSSQTIDGVRNWGTRVLDVGTGTG
ncbi:MAG: hypothetical protein ACHP93_02665 [Solirubrobacterales bacterium]